MIVFDDMAENKIAIHNKTVKLKDIIASKFLVCQQWN